jgi:hypothetical protein
VAAGLLTRRQLQNGEWVAVHPGVYAHRGLVLDYPAHCLAALLYLNGRAALSGVSAAHLLGADLRPHGSMLVEASVPGRAGPRSRPGLRVIHSTLLPGDLQMVGQVLVTTPARTAFDLARRAPFEEAVIAMDAVLHVAPGCRADLERLVGRRCWPGTAGLPAVLAAADAGSESPMETRARLILIDGGLPRPRTQYDVFDEQGRWLARVDLAYPEHKVGVEYEGAGHRTAEVFQRDLRRLNRLHMAGWTILRYGPGDVCSTTLST